MATTFVKKQQAAETETSSEIFRHAEVWYFWKSCGVHFASLFVFNS